MKRKMNNKVAKLIWMLAWTTYIIVFFMGVSAGNAAGYIAFGNSFPFSWAAAFGVWFSGFIVGTLILGFAEIIELLQKLVDKDPKTESVEGSSETILNDKVPE